MDLETAIGQSQAVMAAVRSERSSVAGRVVQILRVQVALDRNEGAPRSEFEAAGRELTEMVRATDVDRSEMVKLIRAACSLEDPDFQALLDRITSEFSAIVPATK